MLSSRKCLGLAVDEQGLTAVQLTAAGGTRSIAHKAALPFSDGADLDSPERLGKALRQLLRQNGVSASHCVLGLPAAWLVAKEKLLPPTDPQSLRGILSIAAEKEFASGADLACDYASWNTAGGTSALLVAAPRRKLDALAAAAKAAGLSVQAATSSTAAVALSGKAVAGQRLVITLLAGAAEILIQSDGAVRMIRHLSLSAKPSAQELAALAGEIKRSLLSMSQSADEPRQRQLEVWNLAGLDSGSIAAMTAALGSVGGRVCDPSKELQISDLSSNAAFVQAAALAAAGEQAPLVDFTHSRLAPPKSRRIGRVAAYGIVAGVVLAAVAALIVVDQFRQRSELGRLQQQLSSTQDSGKNARQLVDDTSFARGWYDRRPRFLDSLRAGTLAFPEQGTIWATNLMVREDMKAVLTGKAVSREAALDLQKKLASNAQELANVKTLDIHKSGAQEYSFAFSFEFRGAD